MDGDDDKNGLGFPEANEDGKLRAGSEEDNIFSNRGSANRNGSGNIN